MYKIGIVEDNNDELQTLREHLKRYEYARHERFDIRVFHKAEDMISGSERFDLLLLDIDLPGISGFEAATLLRSFNEVTPIIFVTSLSQYAVRGYEVEALDFMVKPVSYGSFALRMDKALRVMQRNANASTCIKTKDGLRVLQQQEIAYVEAQRHYCFYHLISGEVLRSRVNISDVANEFSSDIFARISVSYLVNMAQIARIQGNAITLVSGEQFSISRTYRYEALNTITAYLGRGL